MRKSKIFFITTNQSKFQEVRKIMEEESSGRIELVHRDMELEEPKLLSLKETSKEKAIQAFKRVNSPLIVDDTGIIFEEYGNFPGPYSKIFYEMVGFKGIYNLLKDTSRKAYYSSIITFTKDGEKLYPFEGRYRGRMAHKVSAIVNPYFPYDSLFIPMSGKIPRSEMDFEASIEISHRRKAIKKLLASDVI